jgi:thiamine kinase-like enzyme
MQKAMRQRTVALANFLKPSCFTVLTISLARKTEQATGSNTVMSSEDDKHATTEDQIKDQEAKKELVIKALADASSETSEFGDIRKIATALKAGDKLTAKAISGGKTNYSYKICLEGSPAIAVFAKICFSYALWNPDRNVHYDLERVENEFLVMTRFMNMMGQDAPVATPYFCIDVPDNMKVIICQWSKSDEQWANQFIDGEVDMRVIPKVADALAVLNTADFDPMFNDNVRPCMRTIFQLAKTVLEGLAVAEGKPPDKAAAYCQELGKERVGRLINGLDEHYMRREALIHSDPHVFNILVERKPSVAKLAKFGKNGSFVLCDWEMTFAGPIGRDVGIFQCWPLACAFAHAIQGYEKEAYHMFDCNVKFFDAYAKSIVEKGAKDEKFLLKLFRSSMGWTAYFTLIGYYILGVHMEHFPVDGLSEADAAKAKGSLGYTGIKLAEYGFLEKEPELTLEQLRTRYKEIIETDISELLQVAEGRRRRPRRASVLRSSGRRVSDAALMEEAAELVRRVSVASGGRPSICGVIVEDTMKDACGEA